MLVPLRHIALAAVLLFPLATVQAQSLQERVTVLEENVHFNLADALSHIDALEQNQRNVMDRLLRTEVKLDALLEERKWILGLVAVLIGQFIILTISHFRRGKHDGS